MIYLQAPKFQIDLSTYGVSLIERNDLFNDNINRSYSLPFQIKADAELLSKLGIPTLDNISNLETKIKCQLVLPYRYYPATLFLGEISGQSIECNIVFGNDNIPEYDMELKDLPWPLVIFPSLTAHAQQVIGQHWPAVRYNFPMLYRPEFKGKSNYEMFEGFVNNHDGTSFLQNELDNTGEAPVFINRNVLAPFPYLLEILKFGFHTAGKKVFGEVFEDPVKMKALYVPETFLERFKGNDFEEFSFDVPDSSEVSYAHFGVYSRIFTPALIGTYKIKYSLNLDPVLASVFELNIYTVESLSGEETLLYRKLSRNNRVRLEDEVTINREAGNQFDTIRLELKIPYTTTSIAQHNTFEYDYQGGRLNEFPNTLNLADFMPDMTFGEFVNELKNWWNLDIDVQDRYVEINYAQNSVLKKRKEDHSHLEVPDPPRAHNSNRFYKLSYANEERLFYTGKGQIFSELDEEGLDVVKLEMDVQPLKVEQNENVITAVFPEENSALDVCMYDGVNGSNKPTCSSALHRKMMLQDIFNDHWEQWLNFRIRSKTFKDSFDCSVHERINIDELSNKYRELHVIKELRRKYLSEDVMRVDVESETF